MLCLRKPAVVMFLVAISTATPAFAAPGDVFSAGTTAERVWNKGRFTEGVDVGPDGGVYFSDMQVGYQEKPGMTLRFDPKTRATTVFLADNGDSNGQKFDPDGRLWGVQMNGGGTRDVRAVGLDGRDRRVIVRDYQGKPFNALNDLVFDAQGRAWITDVRNLGIEPIEQPFNGVYRLDPDGKLTLVITDMLAPNGIAVSPDGTTLYVAEHPYKSKNLLEGDRTRLPMSLRAYDITADGQVVHGRVLIDFGDLEGIDGMVVDAQGNLVTAFRDDRRRGIRVFSPKGNEIDFLPLPVKPTNVAFGRGAERNILYITAGTGLYRVATKTEGLRR